MILKISMLQTINILVIIGFMTIASVTASYGQMAGESVYKQAYKMMLLSNPDVSDRAHVEKRYRVILPGLIKNCDDVSTVLDAGNMLYDTYRDMDKAGLGVEEGLFALSKNLYRITKGISQTAQPGFNCAEVFSMYVMVRREGATPEEVRGDMTKEGEL